MGTDCAHYYVPDHTGGELAVRCTECGVRVVAVTECVHQRVLQLPPFGISYTVSLQLRQCDTCKRIGIVDRFGETRWMEAKL